MPVRRSCIAALVLCIAASAKADEAVSRGSVEVRFDARRRALLISDKEAGKLLDAGFARASVGGKELSTNAPAARLDVSADQAKCELTLAIAEGFRLRVRISENGAVELTPEGKPDGPVEFHATACLGSDAMPAILKDQTEEQDVLFTTLGNAAVPGAASLFAPEKDVALSVEGASPVAWVWREGWQLTAKAPAGKTLASIRIRRHYYRDELGIKYYAPIRKRTRWQTAPMVAMTWYGIKGWEGKPAQRKEWLYPQIDWVAEHLLPYAGTLVFQLDDNYLYNDDAYMRAISDYIRSKGLLPGIWFTPFTVPPKEVGQQHPDWFLHDAGGKLLMAFGGVNWNYGKGGAAVLNVNKPEAVEAWYGRFWRKASETWNNEFFKIDGQPQVSARYEGSTDGGGIDGYRKGLRVARSIVGEDKFINACWGITTTAIGLVDGSRTGGDTGNHGHAIDVILRWNFLNNVCWWCDPDAAANLYRATVQRTRLNAQARVLTGQQFLTDDVWTEAPQEISRVWQLSYPTLDIRPVNLYEIRDWKKYDVFDLRIARPWGTWDVVGLFNYEEAAEEKELDLGRLKLEAERVHVYDYWESRYLGLYRSDASIQRYMEPLEGQLFAVVPADDRRPVILSTSRHLSQGGADLQSATWQREGDGWRLDASSARLVKGDPYEVAFAAGPYRIKRATASSGRVEVLSKQGIARIRVDPTGSECEWRVDFEPLSNAAFLAAPEVCQVFARQQGRLQLIGLGPRALRWKAVASDKRIKVTPDAGELRPWPDSAQLAVAVDRTGLEAGKAWTGKLKIVPQNVELASQEIEVRFQIPLPQNLARRARAYASSTWSAEYAADRINDGKTSTRWNSRDGDVSGCWVELVWDEPVEFDRVVIDECMDFGNRIQAWRLEAWDGSFKRIAAGKQAGRKHTVELDKPVKTKRLQLVVDEATVVPTIWELEVYRCRK